MSRLVAGNMLTLQLADFGAEVIKIEQLPHGDPFRAWGDSSIATHWKTYGRNKKSVSVNLRDPDGIALIRRLSINADVLVENFIPGRLEEMGLGPDVLHQSNENLIIVRVSGFGQTGPYSKRPGFGTVVEAMSGFADRNGFPDREPVLPPLALADMVAGLYGAIGVLIAIREHEVKGGVGQIIDLSLLEPIFSILGADAAGYQVDGSIKKRSGSASNTASPRNVYQTRDGRWIALSASIQSMADRVFRTIGCPEAIKDPRFATNAQRVKNRSEVDRLISTWVSSRDLDDVLCVFEENSITAGPVYDISQFLKDPHVIEREVVVMVPDEDIGTLPIFNVLPRLSMTPGTLRYPAPRIGEHNDEIYGGIGIGVTELSELRQRGVIG
jgi:crotonobetainyl-CoA:carnitine CoA-transferase CaiB-like acyl-CoA transferase